VPGLWVESEPDALATVGNKGHGATRPERQRSTC
jgi:hypothetical protein